MYLLKVAHLVGTTEDGNTEVQDQQFVKHLDTEAFDGRGEVILTSQSKQAIRFESVLDAYKYYNQVSKTRPYRDDGKPNKPLTAFNIYIEHISIYEG